MRYTVLSTRLRIQLIRESSLRLLMISILEVFMRRHTSWACCSLMDGHCRLFIVIRGISWGWWMRSWLRRRRLLRGLLGGRRGWWGMWTFCRISSYNIIDDYLYQIYMRGFLGRDGKGWEFDLIWVIYNLHLLRGLVGDWRQLIIIIYCWVMGECEGNQREREGVGREGEKEIIFEIGMEQWNKSREHNKSERI